MNLRNLGIALIITLGALPLAICITLLTPPFWRWLEASTGIESIGHSGPAGWCYLAVYGVLVILGGWHWSRRRRGVSARG